ncbi:MAG: hypothetical protein AAFV77_00085, partial [Planctomycetota bacterium]
MPLKNEMTRTSRDRRILMLAAGLATGLGAPVAAGQNQPAADPERSPALIPQGQVAGPGQAQQQQTQSEEPIILGPFAEPVQLRTLLDIAVQQLGVQLAVDTSLT